jgi:nicotinate dehydrogenase subunit B
MSASLFDKSGILLVLEGNQEDVLIAVKDDGSVTGFCGHVDLGTGIRTALGQIVAEELDVAFSAVTIVLGDTDKTPDQGATIASATIQVTAIPLRQAAAQAAQFLRARAAAHLNVPAETLTVREGLVTTTDGRDISYAALLQGEHFRITRQAENVAVKNPATYSIVGRPVARVDIPAKAAGELTFVHDMRLPDMLHGRVIRPPYVGHDTGPFVGKTLISVDEISIRHIPGIVAVVTAGDFVGVVAEREEHAVQAMQELKISWAPLTGLPELSDVATALREAPRTSRTLLDKGDVDSALANAAQRLTRTYVWPYQMHGSIGPACALAAFDADGLTIWSGTQNPHILRADIAKLLAMPEDRVRIIRMETAGCYGRNCADDVCGDAALLAQAVGRPVRVQLSREQEHQWEPKGAAQLLEVDGGLTADGEVAAYNFATCYPSNGAPLLALLLTGRVPATAAVFEMGDRTAIPPYDFENMRITVHDMAPIVRASWLRGVSALPNTFAHECYMDELAHAAGVDPIEFRLRYLKDPRAIALVNALAARAGWEPHTGPAPQDGDILHGRGFAYALYVHSKFPGYGAAYAAWIADVEVNKSTGAVSVTRVAVGQDSGLMINPDGVRHQIEGNVIQSTSRAVKEQVSFGPGALVTSQEWGGYPIITFPELPAIDVLMMPPRGEPPLGAGESASVPSAAAIANAIFHATGVRFREPPFTPERIKAGLAGAPQRKRRQKNWFGYAAAGAATAIGIALGGLLSAAAIAPTPPPSPTLYSAATLARGQALAALGDCAVCHTHDGGIVNAGGRPLETPFGTIYSTNITPDPATGIGAWSYEAFARAMRHGLHRDGSHLYPAFPYPSFTRTSDDDLQALYAYLMSQPPVSRPANPQTKLAFPYNVRPLMAVWNALFLRPGALAADPAQDAAWNRGAYLVESLGHCGACHSPRNAFGAEKTGAWHLAGGEADGWTAPALTSLSAAPLPWTADDFFAYLRTGQSANHGSAAGPMAPVIAGLASLPDSDIRAMAVYLASFNKAAPADMPAPSPAPALAATPGARLFAGACAACHEADGATLHADRPSLALNTNIHAQTPNNLIRAILEGIPAHSTPAIEDMPAFKASLDDNQIADLITYVRARFAPNQPAWQRLGSDIARIRAASSSP